MTSFDKQTFVADDENKPVPGRPRIHENKAARQAAYRERKGKSVQVFLPPQLVADLDDLIQEKQLRDRSEVLAAALKRHLKEARRNR